MSAVVRVNWCSTCGAGHNFGDQLTPVLLAHYGIRHVWAPPLRAQLLVVGSILSKVPSGWRGTILGTGYIKPVTRRDLRRARALAVRGALTRRQALLPATTPLGDPGILVPLLIDRAGPQVGDAVAPHYIDHDLAGRHPGMAVIDILRDPVEVVRAIAGVQGVLYTSSLHALIAADALGVPHVLELADTIGGLHKFTDYASAFGAAPIVPGQVHLTDRAAMEERQEVLDGLFRSLAAA